ncbi:PREDICTED: uncharacterized protein LOC109193110 [Ipomoea nil]|uniref:uncharacterized protein LOC109193110 n=1 Tax=Ipomoea nil TaxID=35883 RepID=UPI000901D619|nr:PREDICTED: uncharacterized protein LOC109193110 [Ipomoea nil]
MERQSPKLNIVLTRKHATDLRTTWHTVYSIRGLLMPNSLMPTQWVPPPENKLKCNVDAALFVDGAGFAAVIRDHNGSFVAAKKGRLGSERDPYVAEALAVSATLTWLKEQNFNNILLESDCLNLCNAFISGSVDFSYVGLIVKQCQSIAKDIESISVSHVKRSANCVAHELARATGSMSGSEV